MMKKFKLIPALLMFTIALLSIFGTGKNQLQKPRVAGTWDLNVQSSAGNGTPVFIFKQENDTLFTGSYSGQLGEAPVKGVVKGNDAKFEFSVSGTLIQYTGIVDGDNMKGTVKFGTMAEGVFTGKRREGKP